MSLEVINPYDQTQVCELPFDDGAALDRKVSAAVDAQPGWAAVPLDERIARVREAVTYFERKAESLATDVTRQMGKPLEQSRDEVRTLLARAAHMLDIAPDALAPDRLPDIDGFRRRIEHIPLGVVFDVAAWNYPLIIAVNVVVPALVAGNAVLLKHSAKTPLCGHAFTEAFASMKPTNLVQDLVLSHEATAALARDSRVSHVSFTGSVDGGRKVYAAAAEGLHGCGLELGGKDAAYVAPDADLAFSADNVVDGACYNAGQSCCGIERVYVHDLVYDEFLDRLHKVMERYHLGDPMDPATTMGPLASRSALRTLEAHVRDAVHRGARVELGGSQLTGSRGNFWLPTLLTNVPNDALIMQEESFGPLVPLARVRDDDDALQRMNDTRFGLTASVWTIDTERAERFAAHLDVGTVFQNRCDYLDPALPWTGARESGIGSTLSPYGYLHLTRRKAIHFRTQL
ncbi:MAG: aldehyde dehydrogenase [Planctomycetes bacterium]|nr:aldehyde dehydrogenase [Planctomycetota bacterium]